MADLNGLSIALKEISRAGTNKRLLRNIAKTLVKRIRTRTRLGKGVKPAIGDDFQKTHRLSRLKESTIQRRRRLKRAGGLTGPQAQPARSGINRTGRTLNRLHFSIFGNKLEIKLDQMGEKIVEHLLDIDPEFDFMNLSAAEFRFIIDEIEKEINKIIKRRLG